MPVALISTRTSPAFGPSRSSSTISSGFLAAKATAARVFIPNSTFAFQWSLKTYCHPHSAHSQHIPNRSAFAHAGALRLLCGGRLVFVFGRTHPAQRIVAAGAQIDIEVIQVTGDVRIVPERRHHISLRRADILATAGDDAEEVAVAYGLDRILQRRRVGRSLAVGSMSDMAFGMIAAISGIGVPVDGAVSSHLEGRAAFLVGVLAVF